MVGTREKVVSRLTVSAEKASRWSGDAEKESSSLQAARDRTAKGAAKSKSRKLVIFIPIRTAFRAKYCAFIPSFFLHLPHKTQIA